MNTDILLDVLIVASHKTSCFGRNVTLKEHGTQGREKGDATMKCKSCGGEINPRTGRCPFCGTLNDKMRADHLANVLEYDRGVVAITGEIKIPYQIRHDLDNETGMFLLRQRFAQMFAEQLMDYIDIRICESMADPLGDMVAKGKLLIKRR